MTPEYNTHLFDPLPESAADTELPCAVEGKTVWIDALNFVRLIAAEAQDLDGTEEPNDADAVLIIRRIESLIAHKEMFDGWTPLGRVIANSGFDKWTQDAPQLVEVEYPINHLSAAGYRYSRYPLRSADRIIPFGATRANKTD